MIAKLRARSGRELLHRGSALAVALLERAGLYPDGEEPTGTRFARILAAKGSVEPAALLDAFRRGVPPLALGLRDPAATGTYVRRHWPYHAAGLVARAERIVAGEFDLLGYRGLDFGTPIDWQLDPVSGRRAPLVHWSRLPYLDASVVGDHKVTWELNRHQHFVTLGQAYALTADERYAECLVARLEAWIEANPPKLGMNWASTLEVAFRAISWVWALRLVAGSPALTPGLYRRALGMLHVHARHIEVHLSTWFSPNTHLTGEALGLLHIGAAFPELARAARWHALGRSVLEHELGRQLHPDGVYFEQSTYYHRYTVDFYLHLALLIEARGEPLPAPLRDALGRALDYVVALVRPDGRSPLIGDEDGGRTVWLNSRPVNDFRDTLGLGAALLGRPEYCFAAGEPGPELGWTFGPGALERFARPGRTEPPTSAVFPAGGHAIMRDAWRDDANYLILDCGPHGRYGHAHADALAIEVVSHGVPILSDSGTFTYVAEPEWRDRFRDARMHSTVTVAGESSAVPAGPFSWRERADARLETWITAPAFDFARASHDGFRRFDPPAVHCREVLFLKEWSCWVLRDRIDSAQEYPFIAHFHAAPGVGIVVRPDGSGARFAAPGGAGLVLAASAERKTLAVRDSSHSRVYGQREPTCALGVAVTEGKALVTVLASDLPGAAKPAPEITFEQHEDCITVRLSREGETAAVVVAGAEWQLNGEPLAPPTGD